MEFFNFNNIEPHNLDPIAHGTIARMFMKIQYGGYGCSEIGITDQILTKAASGGLYLAGIFTITSGEYKNRRIWTNIGLYSAKSNNRWGQIGRCFIRGVIDSINGLRSDDQTDNAKHIRVIRSFADIEDRDFIGRIEIAGEDGSKRNIVSKALCASYPDYNLAMQKQ